MATQVQHSYPIFEKNQVLTHNQLNLLSSYLEEQGRLTRTGLIGIGIVCGFRLNFETEAESDLDQDTLYLSEGVGITSEGYLISHCDCAMTQYREYSIGEHVNYLPFQDSETGDQDVTLWELLSDDFSDEESEEEILPLHQLDDLEEKVVMLFVEMYDQDLKSCLSKGCDEIGVERKLNIRKLLIDKSDLETVLERTGNEDIKSYAKRFELKDYSLKRAEFNPPIENYDSLEEIGKKYSDILFTEDDNPVETILAYWNQAYDAFEPVLGAIYEESPFEDPDEIISAWQEVFEDEEGLNYRGIQYYYDFVKDLILAYREFREVSFDLLTECSPDKWLFPQHLLLGEMSSDCIPSEYRQQFIQTPVYSHQRDLLRETRSLFTRAVKMVKNFNTDIIRDVDEFTMKVTPSCEKRSGLSERAIPYYYTGIGENGEEESLAGVWNYEQVRRCALDEGVLSYENNYSDEESADVPDHPVYKPLQYDRNRYNFYRIEGGLGKSCKEAIEELETKIKQHNLSFDLIAVRTSDEATPVVPDSVKDVSIDYQSGFHDLHEDYYTFRYQLANFLKTGLSAWELYQRFEEQVREHPDEFSDPLSEELKEIGKEAYENIIQFLCQTLPPCIEDFIENFEELKDMYAGAIEFIADKVLEESDLDVIVESARKVEEKVGLEIEQDLLTTAVRFIYQLSDVLFYNRLYSIYYSFRRREYYHSLYFNKHRDTFREFLSKHPGIEHMAGVPDGGTYVLLYEGEEEDGQRIVGDFALPYRCCDDREVKIPVCDDAEARKNIQVAPYARPDFGMTYKNISVDLDLLKNDHEQYDLENEYCEGIGKPFHNLWIRKVEPIDTDAGLKIINNRRSVRFTPPEDFTGIIKFRYEVEKRSNNLTDEGIVTVLVRNYCVELTDFEFHVRKEDEVTAALHDFPGYIFKDPKVDKNLIDVENNGEELNILVKNDLSEPYSFNYTAVSEDEDHDGCGKITLIPVANSEPSAEDAEFNISSDTETGTVIGTVPASDPDGDPLTYEFVSGNTSVLDIKKETGEVFVASQELLEQGDYSFGVKVTDPHGLSDTALVFIRVFEENRPPSMEDQTVEIPVKTEAETVVTTVEATDPDEDPLTFKITAGNTGNAFGIDPQSGEVKVVDPVNFVSIHQFVLEVTVTDPDGLSAKAALAVNIIRENDPPQIEIVEPDDGASFFEGNEIPVVFNLSDPEKIEGVEVFLNGNRVGTTDQQQNFAFVLSPLRAGEYVLHARVTDDEGTKATSQKVSFKVTSNIEVDLGSHFETFTASELKVLLNNREVQVSSNDTRATMASKLARSVETQPISENELQNLSDSTIKNLGLNLEVDDPENRDATIDTFLNLH